jgi:hypothetical protein
MSITIGLVSDNFSIVAADTRRTAGNEYADDSIKISRTNFGWMAAGGTKQFIEHFQELMRAEEVKTLYDVETVFNLVHEYISGTGCKRVDTNGFYYSLAHLQDNQLCFEVEMIDPLFGRRRIKYKNYLQVSTPENSERIQLENKYNRLVQEKPNLKRIVYLIACLIEEASEMDKRISSICDYGIVLKQPDNKVMHLKLREKAETIKKEYEEKSDLSALMEICD